MLGLFFFLVLTASTPDSSVLYADVMDLRNDHGAVYCELFRSADGFPKKANRAFARVKVEIKEKSAVCEFQNLPFGTYAVAAFHDENGNGRLDKNFLGIPKEGIGVSNDAMGRFGSPSFDGAKFVVNNEEKRIVIHIHY